MKNLLIAFLMVAGAAATSAQQVADADSDPMLPSFKWNEKSFDFGTIEKGKAVTHEFRFTNNGGATLIISDVKPSCGCTTPDWTREPIAPGKTGFIKATYNADAIGIFNKTITVSSNTGASIVLTIRGDVK